MSNPETKTTKLNPFPDVAWGEDKMSRLVHTYFDLLFDHQENSYKDIEHFNLYMPCRDSLFINFLLQKSKLEELSDRDVIERQKRGVDTPPGEKYLFRENELLQGLNLRGEMFSFAGAKPETVQAYLSFYLKS